MGSWGDEAWDNDHASDWFADFFDGIDVDARFRQGLAAGPDHVVAAGWLLSRIGVNYVWPGDDLVELLDEAIEKLEAVLASPDQDHGASEEIIGTVLEELRVRRADFAPARPPADVQRLHAAAAAGDVEAVRALLDVDGLDTVDEFRRTPLIRAVDAGWVDVVILLLEAGADPNVQDSGGNTALWWALWNDEECAGEMSTLLLIGGADPFLPNNAGKTPFNLAQQKGNRPTLRLIGKPPI